MPADTQVRARIDRVLAALEREQARREAPGLVDALLQVTALRRLAPTDTPTSRHQAGWGADTRRHSFLLRAGGVWPALARLSRVWAPGRLSIILHPTC